MSVTYKNSSKVLKAHRTRLDCTQASLAEHLGVHVQFVSNWERGMCLPPEWCIPLIGSIMTKVERSDLIAAIGDDARREAVERAGDLLNG